MGLSIMLSSICVATITGLAAARHFRTSRFWIGGTACTGKFHPQIAPRDHDPVGHREDLVEGLHRRGLLDLGQDRGAALGQPARLFHVGGPLHEGQRQPVDTELADELEVLAVLFGQRGQRQDHVGHVHALAVRNRAARHHGAIGEIRAAGVHAQAHLAVIHQKPRPRFEGVEDLLVGELHAARVAGGRVEVEAEGRAVLQLVTLAICEAAAAQFRTLKVGEDRDGAADILFHLPDRGVAGADLVVAAMAHVQAEDIGPRLVELADHVIAFGRGPEGRDDLDMSFAFHGSPFPVRAGEARGFRRVRRTCYRSHLLLPTSWRIRRIRTTAESVLAALCIRRPIA
jgi:hypothetical protein